MKLLAANINIRDNYLAFHHKSVYEYNVLEKKLFRLANAKEETWNELIPLKDDIVKFFKIELSKNINFIYLGEKLNKEFRNNDNPDRRNTLLLLVKYCSIVKTEINTKEALLLADKKRNLNYNEYRNLVYIYYTKVHEFLLKGKGYRYKSGIGTIYINRTQITGEGKKIDFHKTKLRKEELLSKGIKLYNKYEAAQYKANDLPYDGVDYRVWLRAPAYYGIKFINSKYFRTKYDFTPSNYIAPQYRTSNREELAFEVCKTNKDIFNLRCDLRVKIDVYLKRNPEKYMDFDRQFNN